MASPYISAYPNSGKSGAAFTSTRRQASVVRIVPTGRYRYATEGKPYVYGLSDPRLRARIESGVSGNS